MIFILNTKIRITFWKLHSVYFHLKVPLVNFTIISKSDDEYKRNETSEQCDNVLNSIIWQLLLSIEAHTKIVSWSQYFLFIRYSMRAH